MTTSGVSLARKTLEVFKTHGWQNEAAALVDEYGRLCLLAGIAVACGRSAYDGYALPVGTYSFQDRLAHVIRDKFPDRVPARRFGSSAAWSFNDHEDTTFADVELVLEHVALLETVEQP